MSIYRNGNLAECEVASVCNYLTSPNGKVRIHNNAEGCNSPPEIANACGNIMPCLPYGDYYIDKQIMIDNFQTDYPNCTSLSGSVYIFNSDIDSLNGLITIESISNNLAIFYTNDLVSLVGLDSLTSVNGSLYIGGYQLWSYPYNYNRDLVDITSLMNLTNVGYELIIQNNTVLESLSGLDSVVFSSGMIDISGNEQLSICNIESICKCIFSNCYLDISYNKEGCNSEEEIENACLVLVPDIDNQPNFTIYPNPVVNKLNVSIKDGINLSKVIIYNFVGQEVLNSTNINNEIDITSIGKGIFIVELYTNQSIVREKIIIK